MKAIEEIALAALHRRIATTALSMLWGGLSYIEGAREMVALESELCALHGDPNFTHGDGDFAPLHGVLSSSDHFPLGEERRHWASAALERLQPEMARIEAWASSFARPACESLARRFGSSIASKVSQVPRRHV